MTLITVECLSESKFLSVIKKYLAPSHNPLISPLLGYLNSTEWKEEMCLMVL